MILQLLPAGSFKRSVVLEPADAVMQHMQQAHTAGRVRQARHARTANCSRRSTTHIETAPNSQLPADSARRTLLMPLPPGAEANNAVALHRRRWQQRRTADADTAMLAAAAAEAARLQSASAQAASAAARPPTAAVAQPEALATAAEAPQGSLLGTVALITGSTVGAGVLALPSVAAPAGFGPSTAALGGCWAMLAAQAMLLAEVNLGVTAIRAQQRQDSGSPPAGAQQQMVTLRQMAEATLGRAGGAMASAVYLLLSFSLLIAYFAKAGELMTSGSALDPGLAGAGFTAVLGCMMCFGGGAVADNVNRWLTGGLMLLFGGILAYGSGHADAHQLTATVDWQQAPAAVPIIFLSLVYHDLVSVVCRQLGGDRRRVRLALLAGSLLPLAMFVSWDAIMLALTSEPGTGSPADPLVVLIADSGGAVGTAVQGFSLLALATSFIGTCTGLTSTLQSEYAAVTASAAEPDVEQPAATAAQPPANDDEAEAQHLAPQPLVYLAALAPPLGIALAHPGSFLTLLSAAGAYGMSLLYGVMPPLMAWQLRYNRAHDGSSDRSAARGEDDCRRSHKGSVEAGVEGRSVPQSDCRAEVWVPGGRAVLALLCASAVAVEAGQAAISLGH